MATGQIGRIDSFNLNDQDWSSYFEQVESFFTANAVTDELKVAALLSSIGATTYSLLKNLCAPAKPSTKTLAEINEIMSNHLNPKPLTISERYRFYRRDQQPNESVAKYIAEIRRLSVHCGFGNFLDNALRDKLVCGLKNAAIQKQLLTHEELTFQQACKKALAMESAINDATEFNTSTSTSVNAVNQSNSKSKAYKNKCKHCGRSNHAEKDCFFRDKSCNKCGKKGHIAPVCRGEKSLQKKGECQAITTNDSDSEDSNCSNSLYAVDSEKNEPIWVDVNINKIQIAMQLDTGSSVSIINEHVYRDKFNNIPLSDSKSILKTYTKERITVLGTIIVDITISSYHQQNMELYVVSGDGPALLGRDWCPRSVLKSINSVRADIDLNTILHNHRELFSDGIGKFNKYQVSLRIEENAVPVFHKPRPIPYAIRNKVEDSLNEMEKNGVITKVQHSEWGTPIVPVPKVDGSVRVCGDFKITVNPKLKMDHYPIPKIEDMLAKLEGGVKFTKIDLANAYLQLELDDQSKEYLTISTHKGLYQYNRLPFGITCAPAIFQRCMEILFQDLDNVQVYFDDILVTGKDDISHLQTLDIVLHRLEDCGLKLKKMKCEFMKDSVQYLGYKIDKDGLQPIQDKIKAVIDAPVPENVDQLRSFLGLLNYYGRFLPNLSKVIAPLNNLLRKDSVFKWTKKCNQALEEAKQQLNSAAVLAHYSTELPLLLASDASEYGVGAVISHLLPNGDERPIAFASRSLSKAERGYSQLDKEGLAIVFGLKRFHQYLYGRHFTLITDNKPLTSLFHPEKPIPTLAAKRLHRWALLLASHDYEIQYKNTKAHGNADGLSRLPLKSTVREKQDVDHVFSVSQIEVLPVTADDIRREVLKDPVLSVIHDAVSSGTIVEKSDLQFEPYIKRFNELSLHDGCIMWGIRVIIPEKLRPAVLNELHEGHIGVAKMKMLGRNYIWWPGLDFEVESLAKSCQTCQQISHNSSAAILHPWTYPSGPWQRIHVDYAGPFQGHMFLLVIDAYSKWPEVKKMKVTTSTATINAMRDIFSRNGLPNVLVSDNGPQFVSDEFSHFMKMNGITHKRSAPFHPATNGQAERFVQTFKHFMKKNSNVPIHQRLCNFLLTYRNTPSVTTKRSPAELLMNRSLRTRLDLLKPDIQLRIVKEVKVPDSRAIQHEFSVGERVRARSYNTKELWKFGFITEKLGPRHYLVKTDDQTIWKRHINQLKSTDVIVTEHIPKPDMSVVDTYTEPTRVLPMQPEPVPAQVIPTPVTPATTPATPATPAFPRRNPIRARKAPEKLNLFME
jgi:hypothetical protein